MSEINDDRTVERILLSEPESKYGEDYRAHYLSLYRDYVASADTVSARRNTANSFFLTINSAFLGARGYFEMSDNSLVPVQAAVGVLFCLVWWKLIQSYKSLNGSKFDVIQMMERHLPLAAFTAEELVQHTSPKVHRALSTVESYVPALFGLLHVGAALLSLNG
jgi:hypothetical protein